jgi:hypothetical protein
MENYEMTTVMPVNWISEPEMAGTLSDCGTWNLQEASPSTGPIPYEGPGRSLSSTCKEISACERGSD